MKSHPFLISMVMTFCISFSTADGADWANQAFENRHHNFGNVARAARVEHIFEFTNPFQQTLQVAAVRASCGCTTPVILTKSVKPGESGQILARFNTRSFLGQRGATLTGVFNSPRHGEAQLRVDGYVRKDVVCDPGELAFGTIQRGTPSVKSVDIMYAGKANWKILNAESAITGLDLHVEETSRQDGRVNYLLTATYTPTDTVGYLNGDIYLRTSDRSRPFVPLQFSTKIVEPISVSPSPMLFGKIPQQSITTKKLILRGEQPFKVLSIHSKDDRVRCKHHLDSKKLHLITVTIDFGNDSQDLQCQLEISTDCEAAKSIVIEVQASAS